jgi:hypothetical protein
MCHQTVGLVAGELERHGIATTSITMLPDITRKVRTPRALAVPFALGYPLGMPGDPALQKRIMRSALELLRYAGPLPVIEELQPEGPAGAILAHKDSVVGVSLPSS